MDAATTGLVAGLGSAAIVGAVSVAINSSTIRNERQQAHRERLLDRRMDVYRDVAIFSTRINGFLKRTARETRGKDAQGSRGPDIPDDNEWSALTGTLLAFGSGAVEEKFQTLHSRLGALGPHVFDRSSPSGFRAVSDDQWPEVKAKLDHTSGACSELVAAIHDEMTIVQTRKWRRPQRVRRRAARSRHAGSRER